MRRVKAGEGGGTAAPYGNRIHRDDLSRLIVHCLLRDLNGESVPPTLVGADHDTTPTRSRGLVSGPAGSDTEATS